MSSIIPFLIFLFILLHPSTALRHRHLPSPASQLHAADEPPTTYFEVSPPINHPRSKPCSVHVLRHDFGYTYGKPPVLAPYNPPTNCSSGNFSTAVLDFHASSKGRQFDRIFGVWLAGVEILRSCTAEPRPNGIQWKVEKDISKYLPLLMAENQTLAVYIGNLVDQTYTGIYHVKISIHFYPTPNHHSNKNHADLILPISRNLPLNDGLWFEIQNSTDVQTKKIEIPRNVYRAALEVYVSFHENDEFWYTNPPNDTVPAGSGPFREVLITLDGSLAGAICPFTVIYTGGINPLLWRPISAIGSFNLPTYDVEITPFLGGLLDGKAHEIGFSVTNALNVWYVDANLHLWLDEKSSRTKGKLLGLKLPPLELSTTTESNNSKTVATRTIESAGWVKSSQGKITTKAIQRFSFVNEMESENPNIQTVRQTIDSEGVVVSNGKREGYKRRFPLHLYTEEVDGASQDTYELISNVTIGFEEKTRSGSVKNRQTATGRMVVEGNLVRGGEGNTEQVYEGEGEDCYFRSVGSRNYSIVYDYVWKCL